MTAFLSLPRKFNQNIMNHVIGNLLEKKQIKKRIPKSVKKNPEFRRRVTTFGIQPPVLRGPKFNPNATAK